MALPKCFIPIGRDSTLNVACIDKCFVEKKSGKIILIDKFGNKFFVNKKVLKGKLEWQTN